MTEYFGNLLMNRRNAAKYSYERLAELSKLSIDRVKKLESGEMDPTLSELEKLASAMVLSTKDLRVRTKDTENGIKYVSAEQSKASRRLINRQAEGRDSKLYYSYQDTAFTTAAPHVRGVILDILCTEEEDVVQNEGHFQDAITFITKGPIYGYWPNQEGETVRRLLEEGHSYFARGFAPHTYRSLDPDNIGQILSFTFTQHLSGDAQDELMLLGKDRAKEYIQSPCAYGNLLYWNRNNSLLTTSKLAELSGVSVEKIIEIEESKKSEPLLEEVLRLAGAMHISPCELIPTISDAPYGTVHFTPEDSLKTKRIMKIDRNNLYEVCDLARSTEMSSLRAHRMKALQNEEIPYLHSNQHTMIFMYKGVGMLYWKDENAEKHEIKLNNYDSVYIEPFIKHGVRNIEGEEQADFLRIQYPTNLSGDAMKELYHKGREGAGRIAREAGEWAKGQSQH